jgi:Protein of unknown function (DUF3352)
MRALYAALLSTLVLAAGCGGEQVGAVDGASPAAELKPGALAYWETVTDLESDQWQQADELLRRFPDGEKWIAELRRMVAEKGVDWEQDVKPALGGTTAVAVYQTSRGPEVLGLTNPEDPDKTVALAGKLDRRSGGNPTVTRVIGDWVVLADSDAAIDAALKTGSGSSLADDEGFKAALDKLPDDALTRVYADPAAALEAFGSVDRDALPALRMLGLDRLDFAGAWATAKDEGAELAVTAGGEGAAQLLGTGEPYASALLQRVPEDAFAFISFQGRGVTRQFEQFRDNPLFSMAYQQFERELGIELDELVALLDGEVAFYARPGIPIPELTLVLDSDNAEQARASADKLLRTLARKADAPVTEDGDVTTAVFDRLVVNLAAVDGLVVLTTSKRALTELTESGDKLPDSDRFKAALDTAGVPDEYTGLAYVELAEVVALLQVYLETTGSSEQLPPEVARNLEALTSLVAWGTLDGDVASALAFLEID